MWEEGRGERDGCRQKEIVWYYRHSKDGTVRKFLVSENLRSESNIGDEERSKYWGTKGSMNIGEETNSCTSGSDHKESAGNAGDLCSVHGWRRSPGEGNGYPLQYSCLENPMDRGAWQATVHGVAKTQIDWATEHKFILGSCHGESGGKGMRWGREEGLDSQRVGVMTNFNEAKNG